MLRSQLRTIENMLSMGFVECRLLRSRAGTFSLWRVSTSSSASSFWEGATENHDICEELLEELERRGLKLSKQVIWVTDGGGGIIKALKGRYGKKLIHQRCTLHKDRNIQRHLPKRYRKRAHHLFATALEQNSYKDAKKMLQEFERWLRGINESAADSLLPVGAFSPHGPHRARPRMPDRRDEPCLGTSRTQGTLRGCAPGTTVTEAGKAFGVTPSSVSRHLVEATAKQLKHTAAAIVVIFS